MSQPRRYPFIIANERIGKPSSLPILPLTLKFGAQTLSVNGLLDTGAMVNVMPYDIGQKLGAVFEEQTEEIYLTGNLARQAARVLTVQAVIEPFSPVTLRFAWSRSNEAVLLLGQLDFFSTVRRFLFAIQRIF